MKKLFVLLDPGHGKETPGKRSPETPNGRLYEYEYNRDVAERIKRLCIVAGIQNHILVPEINDISLGTRVRRANEYKVPEGTMKIFISIHANAAGDGVHFHSAEGFEVFTTPGETKSDKIATALATEFKEMFPGAKHRWDLTDKDADKEENFYVIKNTSCPAVLTETGFYTNEAEVAKMMTSDWRERVAQAHVNAFIKLQELL